MLNRKHYKAIANAIHEATIGVGCRSCLMEQATDTDILVTRLSQVFKLDNPNFNADKFRVACRFGANRVE